MDAYGEHDDLRELNSARELIVTGADGKVRVSVLVSDRPADASARKEGDFLPTVMALPSASVAACGHGRLSPHP
ncbi:hypothetical protein [Microbacterium sp.]|uniref:hypothetical protein n=1 Tax=Microbacterium sp. TaxID=51671 RepID=UPI0039E495BE